MRLLPAVLLSLLLAQPCAADELAFSGVWTISGAAIAPWENPDDPIRSDVSAEYVGKTVTIAADSIEGPGLMGCGKTELTVESQPFAGLFEGGLGTDPHNPAGDQDPARADRLARQLGFAVEPVPTLYQGCSELSLHLRDAHTVLFGLDNRIFTMRRH